MLNVLADDITGAAEIAGIAVARGLKVSLTVWTGDSPLPYACTPIDKDTDVCVTATDIRSEGTLRLTSTKYRCPSSDTNNVTTGNAPSFFLKTDSALRGHIIKQAAFLMQRHGHTNTLLMAQNPSKGRTIRNGIYSIDGKPLTETPFSYDPEFPALSAKATQILLNNIREEDGENLPPLPLMVSLSIENSMFPDGKIYVADASCREDMLRQYAKAGSCTLLAGAADFFGCILDNIHGKTNALDTHNKKPLPLCTDGRKTLIVRGSTQSKPILGMPFLKTADTATVDIPDDVFEGSAADTFIEHATQEYIRHSVFVLSVGKHEVKGQEYAIRLKEVMALAVEQFMAAEPASTLIIEGGATAFCILKRLGLHTFSVMAEYAPGVVGMKCNVLTPCGKKNETSIILKPGSYPWGELFGQGIDEEA